MESSSDLERFANLDVLHVTFWYEKRTSISKIVDNIVANVDLRQAIVSFPDFRCDLAATLNETRPKIIHLHYGGEHPESEFLRRLTYKPRIVHSVQTAVLGASIFADIADRIVCIDEHRIRLNPPGKSVWIENSVDVSNIPRHSPNHNGICNALRFSPDQVQPGLLDLYARLNSKIYFYGADDFLAFSSEHNRHVCEYAKSFANIECLPYCHDLERQMIKHSFFTFYLRGPNNPLWCYGLNVMEAVSLGMPVVAIKRGQMGQQYVLDGINGFVVNSDEEMFTRCKEILDCNDLYLELCANASRHAKEITNSMPQEYAKVYLSLL